MIKGRFESRAPDFWPHMPIQTHYLGEVYPRNSLDPLKYRDLSVSQTLPCIYTHFSELCMIAGGHRSGGIGRWGPLMPPPWGQATGTALPEGLSWSAEGGLGKSVPCSLLTCPQRIGFLLDTWWQAQNVSKRNLGLISHEMDSTYHAASNSPLIYCPRRLVFSERVGGGRSRNCFLSQDFFSCRCLQLALPALLPLWVHTNNPHNHVSVLITFLLLN